MLLVRATLWVMRGYSRSMLCLLSRTSFPLYPSSLCNPVLAATGVGGGVAMRFNGGSDVSNCSMTLSHSRVWGNTAGAGGQGGGVYFAAVPGCLACPCYATIAVVNSSLGENSAGECVWVRRRAGVRACLRP